MSDGITIAIPFHRGLPYLEAAIESVRAQGVAEWTLLVCDDGGFGEGAEALINALGDPRVRYRSRAGSGMVQNWNACLDAADTPLVTLLHADDRLLPDYVEAMMKLAEAHPDAAALGCGAEIIDAEGRRAFSFQDAIKRFFVPRGSGPVLLRGEPGLRVVMAGNFVMCPTLCFRLSKLDGRRFADHWKQVQDLELTARLLLDGDGLVVSRSAHYAYRRHAGNATAAQSESLLRFDEEFALFDEVATHAMERGWHDAARVAQRKGIVRAHLGYRALGALARLQLARSARLLRYAVRRTR